MKNIIRAQFIVLFLGTVFAWTNFSIELKDWLNNRACSLGCTIGEGVVNPFLTPCFYGAIFFLIAFILSAILVKKSKTI